MPFFDADGRMTHKLLAARGAAAGEQRRLEEVQVVYFAADDPTRIVQRLTATDALWSEKAGTLSGSGTVKVDTEDNHLSGVGYDFALETSVLRIHREFRMSNDDCVLTGDRATANLVIERAGDALKLRDLRRCQVEGHLHFRATKPNPSFPFQEAFTDLAIYDGVARTITMPHAVQTLGNGHEGTTHSAVIRLEPRRPASPKR